MFVREVISPFGVFLLRQAILSVPGELLDAARIDGASTFRYNQAFDRHREGYASAIAAVFFCSRGRPIGDGGSSTS